MALFCVVQNIDLHRIQRLNTLDIADLSIETYPIHISNSDTFEMTIYDDPLGTTTSTSNACFSSGHVWEGSELLSEYLVVTIVKLVFSCSFFFCCLLLKSQHFKPTTQKTVVY